MVADNLGHSDINKLVHTVILGQRRDRHQGFFFDDALPVGEQIVTLIGVDSWITRRRSGP